MTVIGLWLAIVGYGLAFSGYIQLGGGSCSIIDAFRGQCQPGQARTTAATSGSGVTLLSAQQSNQRSQAGMISSQPISQVA